METQNTIDIKSYLTFELGEEYFAAHVSKVLNILEMIRITKVPKAPEYMRGVINLRGMVLPVVDTRIKFGLSKTEITKNTCILVLEVEIDHERIQVGALVDSVQEVIEIDEEEIKAAPSIGNKYRSEFINGMYQKDENTFIMLLDMDLVFSEIDIAEIREFNNEKAEA